MYISVICSMHPLLCLINFYRSTYAVMLNIMVSVFHISDEQDSDPRAAVQQRSSDSSCSCSRTSNLLLHPETLFTASPGGPGVLHQTRA